MIQTIKPQMLKVLKCTSVTPGSAVGYEDDPSARGMIIAVDRDGPVTVLWSVAPSRDAGLIANVSQQIMEEIDAEIMNDLHAAMGGIT